MLHRTIFYSYVCKANNNVKKGRCLNTVFEVIYQNRSETKETENMFGKQKTVTNLKAMKTTNDARETEKLKKKCNCAYLETMERIDLERIF